MTKNKNNKLRNLRILNKMNYENVAKKIGISKSYYWQIENGNKRIYYDLAIKIANIYSLKPDDIFYDYYKEE